MTLARGLGTAQVPKTSKAVESRRLNRFVVPGFKPQPPLQRGRCRLRFVILKGWRDDMRLLRIGAVNRLAVMPKRSLGKPLRHPDNLGPFRPSHS